MLSRVGGSFGPVSLKFLINYNNIFHWLPRVLMYVFSEYTDVLQANVSFGSVTPRQTAPHVNQRNIHAIPMVCILNVARSGSPTSKSKYKKLITI